MFFLRQGIELWFSVRPHISLAQSTKCLVGRTQRKFLMKKFWCNNNLWDCYFVIDFSRFMICWLMKCWLYWIKDNPLLLSLQFLYLIKDFIPPPSGLITYQYSLCSTEFSIFISPHGLYEEIVVRKSLATVFHAYSGFVPFLTHCVASFGVLVVTFARVIWNYGRWC